MCIRDSWTVPVSIVRKDLIPKMQAEPDYLTKNKIRILDPKNNELPPAQINWFSEEAVNYKFKQDPGDLNSLGSIRINFPSPHGVYMHLSLIHISEPTRLLSISYAVF